MEIKTGTSRTAIILPLLGIALKFPRVKILPVLNVLRINLLRGTLSSLLREEFSYPVELRWGLKGMLLGGIAANLSERRFWKATRHPFIQPTRCSLAGLLNVQEYGEPCEPDLDVWSQLLDITDREVYKDRHHFQHQGNYCYRDGWLSMHDYGNRRVQEVIAKYGLTILERFDRTRKERWR